MIDLPKMILKLQLEAKYQKDKIESQLKSTSRVKIKNSKKFVSTRAKKAKEKSIKLNSINSKISFVSTNSNLQNRANTSSYKSFSHGFNFSTHKNISSSFSTSHNKIFSSKKLQHKKNINVIVKSNYKMAGRLQNGKRATQTEVKNLSIASINYIENHGSKDLENSEELSNIYDSFGDRLTNEEFQELKKEVYHDEQLTAMRKIVISPKEDISREEMKDLTLNIMKSFEEQTDKNLNYHFAIHTDTEHIHAHVVIVGTNRDINFTKEQLQIFKDISQEKTLKITQNRNIEIEKDLHIKKEQEIEL